MVPVATSSWRAVPDKFPKLACVYLPTSKLVIGAPRRPTLTASIRETEMQLESECRYSTGTEKTAGATHQVDVSSRLPILLSQPQMVHPSHLVLHHPTASPKSALPCSRCIQDPLCSPFAGHASECDSVPTSVPIAVSAGGWTMNPISTSSTWHSSCLLHSITHYLLPHYNRYNMHTAFCRTSPPSPPPRFYLKYLVYVSRVMLPTERQASGCCRVVVSFLSIPIGCSLS
jgi:hypothetical protein